MIEPLAAPPRQKITRAVLLRAGAGYGLLFGLGFALLVWGYDGLVLSRSSTDMAWAKLLLGLPCALVIGGIVGEDVLARLPAGSAAARKMWRRWLRSALPAPHGCGWTQMPVGPGSKPQCSSPNWPTTTWNWWNNRCR